MSMTPADNRSRTIVFCVVVLASTAVVVVGMITHTISESLILAIVSTPIASIMSFFGGRVTAPPTPQAEPPSSTSWTSTTTSGFTAGATAPVLPAGGTGRGEVGPSATAFATAIRLWWHRRHRRPPMAAA